MDRAIIMESHGTLLKYGDRAMSHVLDESQLLTTV